MTVNDIIALLQQAVAANPEVGQRDFHIEGPRVGVKTAGPAAAGPGFTFACAGIKVPEDEGIVYAQITPGDLPPMAFWGALG